MLFSLFYNSSRVSKTNLKLPLLRIKWALGLFVLCISFNTALAGQIAFDDFETGSLTDGPGLKNGFKWGSGKNATVSTEQPKTGAYSLKFRFPAVHSEGNNYSDAEMRFKLGGYYPEVWIKYDLYIPPNYYHRNPGNNKFMMIWAGTYEGANREGPVVGGHFWPKSSGESSLATWVGARINGVVTLDENWNCGSCGNGKSSYGILDGDKGHWMTLVIHVKYATQAQYLATIKAGLPYGGDEGQHNGDGVYEVWKTNWQGNTEKLIDIHDGPWYATKPNSTEPARGFDQGYLLGWANSGFVEETSLYMDNVTFSTDPLSNDYVPDNTAAPKPPIIVAFP